MAEKISGPQKAALFLFAIGEEVASEIVKKFDEAEIKQLGGSMAKISAISSKTMDSIFSEFSDMATSRNQPITIGQEGSSRFIKSVLTKGMDQTKAQTLLEEIKEEEKWNLFQKIRKLDPKTLASFIRNEHPQTIAIILAHLDPMQTGALLQELPVPLQGDVMFRIAELDKVSPGILEEVDQVLQEEMALVESVEGKKMGGVRAVAEILNNVDNATEGVILKGMEEHKQGLADEIRKLMFMFEDLIQVDDRGIMAILKEVQNEVLQLALKTGSEELKEKVFKNMSERAAQMMKEDLEVMGPVRLKDVETAQQTIIKIAKKLENEGKLMLAGKGKEETFV